MEIWVSHWWRNRTSVSVCLPSNDVEYAGPHRHAAYQKKQHCWCSNRRSFLCSSTCSGSSTKGPGSGGQSELGRRLGAVSSKLSSGRQQFVRTARARKPFSSGVVCWDIYFVKHITVEMVEGLTPNSTWHCTIVSEVTLACGCSPDQSHMALSG